MKQLKEFIIKGIANSIGSFYKDTTKIRCFTYHNISDSGKDKFTLSNKIFVQHIEYIYENEYRTIDSNFFLCNRKPKLSDKKVICLTFDDGFKNNLYVADLLLEYKLKAIFFITTSFVNQDKYLDWGEVKELSNRGFEIGSHSHTHRNFRMLNNQELYNELSISKDILQNKLGKEIKSFAFPFGKINTLNEIVYEILEKTNYLVAYTQIGGHITENLNIFKIPRNGINSTDNVHIFRKKLEGNYDVFKNITYLP